MTNGGRSSAGRVAIAGIAATALVGVAGSITTWVVARDNRATQVTLARDQRIYDRRATAYVEVLVAMQALSDDLRLLRFEKIPTWPVFQRKEANLRARMTALGSIEALRLYNTWFFSASSTLAEVSRLRKFGRLPRWPRAKRSLEYSENRNKSDRASVTSIRPLRRGGWGSDTECPVWAARSSSPFRSARTDPTARSTERPARAFTPPSLRRGTFGTLPGYGVIEGNLSLRRYPA